MSQRLIEGGVCDSCGAKTVEYRHRLGRFLGQALQALADAGGGPVNLQELGLTRNEWDNFQKLRYFALAEKTTRADGSHVAGTWHITPLGWAFVRGQVRLPEHVWTYRGDPVRAEGSLVSITQLTPGYEIREDYAAAAIPRPRTGDPSPAPEETA